ncbi:MAG: FapA family protein [Oscillospiraceae bacterium]|nr:FapA family protein [Oscillospiraceae bacterium]
MENEIKTTQDNAAVNTPGQTGVQPGAETGTQTPAPPPEPPPPPPPPVNAEGRVFISKDELEARIRITPPQNDGLDLSFAELKILLIKNGIMFGMDNEALAKLAAEPTYDTDIVIARGVNKRDGEAAELKYLVELERKLMPKETEDGKIDLRDIGAVQEVKKDDVLCEKIAATPGIPGTTVKGAQIVPTPGKDKAFPAGKNTAVSADGFKLLASIDGHVSFSGNKINILDVFLVAGDVSSQTGNINFSGNVIVRGNVLQGFTISSSGDVTVSGSVESAKITAGGNLVIRGGFRGGESGELDVSGNAACGFIEGGSIRVRGNLNSSYIINSTVKCGGSVILGGKGMIRGGAVTARESITANYIGAKISSVLTVVEVGNDPEILERFKKVAEDLSLHEKNMRDVELLITTLLKLKQVNRLTPEKAANLDKAVSYMSTAKQTQLEIREEHAMLSAQMADIGYGKVHVKNTAYHGTKIIMGTDVLNLHVDYSYVTFFRDGEGVNFAPFR